MVGKLKGKKLTRNFLTEAVMSEVEVQMEKQVCDPLTYEEMISEIDSIKNGMRSRDDDLVELRRRLNKCQADINVREAGFVGIDKTLHEIHSQNKLLMKKIKSVSSFTRSSESEGK